MDGFLVLFQFGLVFESLGDLRAFLRSLGKLRDDALQLGFSELQLREESHRIRLELLAC